jgi:hypothetical protein
MLSAVAMTTLFFAGAVPRRRKHGFRNGKRRHGRTHSIENWRTQPTRSVVPAQAGEGNVRHAAGRYGCCHVPIVRALRNTLHQFLADGPPAPILKKFIQERLGLKQTKAKRPGA